MNTKTTDYAATAKRMLEGARIEEREGVNKYFISTDNQLATGFIMELMNEGHSLDYCHEFTWEALNVLADSEAKTEDEANEVIDNLMEADIYTHDLTRWLHNSNYHVYWLTEALESFDPSNGFEALSCAQQLAKAHIGHLLVDYITNN